MSNLENNDEDYKFLNIVDALISLNQKVNLIGVVTETGIAKHSRGTDKNHRSGVNALFDQRFSSFALYDGRGGSNLVPYQVLSKFHPGKQDKKFIERLRKWTVSHQPERGIQVKTLMSF